MAVLMIGSTGSGKSTLGNYLVDPSETHITSKRDQTFATASDSKPHTQNIKAAKARWGTGAKGAGSATTTSLTIIDTPGLNESGKKDLFHMISIVEKIKEIGEIQACLFVVKFNNKLDAQYKATVKYYSKLLPSLFRKNVVIVMTEFAQDDRSVKMRERQHVDVEKVKTDAIDEIMLSGGIWYTPTLFTMDCLPLGDEEERVNLEIRETLLDYIFSQTPVSPKSLKVAKPQYLLHLDALEAENLEGQIKGFSAQLKDLNKSAERALNEVEENERHLTIALTEEKSLQEELDEMDCSELITLKEWSVSESGKWFRTLTKPFKLESEYRITDVKVWKRDDKVKLKEYDRSESCVQGVVSGKFFGGVSASVKIETTRRIRFKKDIKDTKERQRELITKKKDLKNKTSDIKIDHKDNKAEIEKLQKFIKTKQSRLVELKKPTMSMEEAIERAQERR